MSTTDLVVVMVSDTWHDSVRRGFYSTADQFILSAAADPRIGTILVADGPRGVLSQVSRRLRGERSRTDRPGIALTRPWSVRTSADLTEAGQRRRYRAYDRQLAAAVRRHRLRSPALVTFNSWHAAAGRPRWAAAGVFYAQDDEAAFPQIAARRGDVRRAYRRIGAGDLEVVAVSEVLLERIGDGAGGRVVANGIDPDLWRELPAVDVDTGDSPLVSYVGTVDDRLDLEAFTQLSRAGFRVQLAGSVRDTSTGRALAALPGVELVGVLPRDGVVRQLQRSDVVLLAHRSTPMTEAMSPLKLYEYLASGRPVVATALSGTRVEAGEVELVEPGGDYVVAVRRAVARAGLDETRRRALVERLSWRARHAPVLDRVAG